MVDYLGNLRFKKGGYIVFFKIDEILIGCEYSRVAG